MWPNTFHHRILIFYWTSLSITWSLSTGCSLTQEVPSDSQSAVWYPSSNENSINTAANIFPPRQEVMACMYSHNRINQAVFVIVIYLGLSWVLTLGMSFFWCSYSKPFTCINSFQVFWGRLELQLFWRQSGDTPKFKSGSHWRRVILSCVCSHAIMHICPLEVMKNIFKSTRWRFVG